METVADLSYLATSIGVEIRNDLVTQSSQTLAEWSGHRDSSAKHTVSDNVRKAAVGVTQRGPFSHGKQVRFFVRSTDYGCRCRLGDPVFVPEKEDH
ncbi:hypothetical protein Acy02nite_83060 [Actinoplanes cyaneus]|uniref:Uncharacterized protein n=1 Tax=Actinoplanes cyaneus TaxID=52696 RepID=A0A919IQM6_9ACTN|nr:hypothetical protein Acy02nite_83060 [Actinoplanes cyaneus]